MLNILAVDIKGVQEMSNFGKKFMIIYLKHMMKSKR